MILTLIIGALIILTMAVLGGACKFYQKYLWWDRLMHFLSGILFVSLGVALSDRITGLDRFHILFFSFTLSVTLHVVWEIVEYIVDRIKGSNHQRPHSPKPPGEIQPAGILDTMNDTIMAAIGTISACAIWWFIL